MKIAIVSFLGLLSFLGCGGPESNLHVEMTIPAINEDKLDVFDAKLKIIDSQNRAMALDKLKAIFHRV